MLKGKRWLALLLVATLLLTAGCQTRQETAPTETQTQPSGTDNAAESGTAGAAADYADTLFDTTRVHTVDVTISEEDWADLCANPLQKTKYSVNVTIDGETVEQVSFATKGNTSLTAVAGDADSNRYSFKINFGKYVKGQTYHGLNKLSLNNLYADATYLKDYLSYRLFRELGVDAPLVSYVWLTLNGEAQGLYIAVEDLSESYLDRTQDGEGVLYKPETEQLANMGDGGGMPNMPENGERPEMPEGGEMPSMPENGERPTMPDGGEMPTMPENGERPTMPENGEMPTPPDGGQFPGNGGFPGGNSQFPGNGDGQFPGNGDGQFPGNGDFPGGMPGFGGGANGAALAYTDDDPASYSDIFDNSETDASSEDEARVIAALKALSAGDTAAALDTDEVIRYFAAHNFVLNYDSYTGTMLHNYYLYENDGKLSMLPWDYNLAFGGFSGGSDATGLINTGIDTPLSGATADSRPMWSWIAADETYLTAYHEALNSLLTSYFESGAFESELEALREMLRPYVAQDPSAFYTAEEFETACETLRQFCLLRAESIRRQLDGTLATETDRQQTADRVDASALDLKSMGAHMGGEKPTR